MPKWFLPRLTAAQTSTCQIINWQTIGKFVDGSATIEDLWDWAEGGFTYARMIELLQAEGVEFEDGVEAAIEDFMEIIPSVMGRYQRTGTFGLSGTELQIARRAAEVSDGLLELDRHGIAVKAAVWAGQHLDRLVTRHRAGKTRNAG